MLRFGVDLGPVKKGSLNAPHHCELRIDDELMGYIYQVREGYEYRGKAVGAYEMEWVARSDKRDLIDALEGSLAAVKKRKSRAKRVGRSKAKPL